MDPKNLIHDRCRTHPTLRVVTNDRGSVLAIVTLLLIVFLGLVALAVDLGMLYVARGEAQRTADAAAHAGAGHLMLAPFDEDGARSRAIQFASHNTVRGMSGQIDSLLDIDVVLDSQKVRVRVHRSTDRLDEGGPVPTLFAGILGFNTADVGASAAAQAWPGVASDCILPFAIPDHWFVNEDDAYRDAGIGDTYDSERDDLYIAAADHEQHTAEPPSGYTDPWPGYTGYGQARIGQEIQLTTADPSESPQPGWYYPIRLPGSTGGNDYRNSIKDCWEPGGDHKLGDEVDKEPGNMVGPTEQGFGDIFGDPDEQNIAWDHDQAYNCPRRTDRPADETGAAFVGDCVNSGSRRIRPLVMFNPEKWEDIDNGAKPVPITAFAGVFLDDWDGNNAVTVRWMNYPAVQAADEFEMCADCLLRVLRIVE